MKLVILGLTLVLTQTVFAQGQQRYQPGDEDRLWDHSRQLRQEAGNAFREFTSQRPASRDAPNEARSQRDDSSFNQRLAAARAQYQQADQEFRNASRQGFTDLNEFKLRRLIAFLNFSELSAQRPGLQLEERAQIRANALDPNNNPLMRSENLPAGPEYQAVRAAISELRMQLRNFLASARSARVRGESAELEASYPSPALSLVGITDCSCLTGEDATSSARLAQDLRAILGRAAPGVIR